MLAANELDLPGQLEMLAASPCAHFDGVVLSISASDATGLLSPLRWVRSQDRLAALINAVRAEGLSPHTLANIDGLPDRARRSEPAIEFAGAQTGHALGVDDQA